MLLTLQALVATEAGRAALASRTLIILMDAKAAVRSLLHGRASHPRVRELVRAIYHLASAHSFWFVVAWLPRELNQRPDALTKAVDDAAALAVCTTLGLTFHSF